MIKDVIIHEGAIWPGLISLAAAHDSLQKRVGGTTLMAQNLIAFLVGIAIVILGAIVWVFRPANPNADNKISLFGLFDVTLSTPAIAIMAMGVVLILVSTRLPGPTPDAAVNVHENNSDTSKGVTNSDVAKPHPVPVDNGMYTVLFYYRHNRISDAKTYVAAALSAGFKSSSIATELTEVDIGKENEKTSSDFIIPSRALNGQASAIEERVYDVLINTTPPDAKGDRKITKGGVGDIARGDIVVYLY
jgi:hypothetical protein